MKYALILSIPAIFLALACGPSVAVKIIGAEDSNESGGGDGSHDDVVVDYGGSSYDAPAHTFTPRPIPNKPRSAVMAADLNAMPPLRLRLGECYGIYDEEEAAIATGPSGIGTAAGSSGVRRSSGASKGKASSRGENKTASSKPRRQKQTSALDSLLSTGGGSSKKEARKPATTAPPTATFDGADMDMASEAPMEMAESAPMEDYDDAVPGDRIATDEAPLDEYEDWGAAIYLSNDDSMSLSSAQRVMYAIDNFLPLPAEHIRPHELLNYFTFDTAQVEDGHDFSVYADIAEDPREEAVYNLGLSISGRPVTKETRRNVALTWVIDRSGSMRSEGRTEYLKRGLQRSVSQLKRGDMVHMVLFDHNVCTPVENFVVGRDSISDLNRAIDALQPQGSTDIHAGLQTAYRIADQSYQGHHSNRVVLVTDALANTGVTDEEMIAMISRYYDTRRIRLSGVGVGREFNDALLDRLTERGKGAYVFLGSEAEVDAVFGERFISLIETVALDVHFRLHLPESLRMNVFYGEESSVHKEDVQAIHYFANTSQLFLSDVVARGGSVRPMDDIMLTIEYEDPESGDEMVEEYAFNLRDVIDADNYNVKKARLIITWIDMLAVMAARNQPSQSYYRAGGWIDEEAFALCEDGRQQLNTLAEPLEGDPETTRVLQLWEKYCARYERPREPVRRDTLRRRTPSWPGAIPEDDR
ncbi:MAG: VWA domain-containing protein [Deltaproteobacteria bacterium]|nr:VWA domain-containing protein [Deltaproteobacteria bacterium]MBN2674577.1 VWA domain-containing protein [Deltaproteobacteria bacterium]